MKGCGKGFTYLKEKNVTITMECGTSDKEITYLCDKCSSKTSNQNQPKYASAISGGNADVDANSLESRYDSKKVDTPQDDSGVVSRAAKEGSVLSAFPAGLSSELNDRIDS